MRYLDGAFVRTLIPLVWLKESEIQNLEGDMFWDTAMSNEPAEGFIPLHAYKELNLDYKKEWITERAKANLFEKQWIFYRDLAVKLDKELKELKEIKC